MTASRELIRLTNAGVQRDGRWLVRHVDMVVERGKIVTLIGPNGSGKSTSVKMALSILAPDEGSVTRADGLVVSYVPQKAAIDWTMPISVARFMRLTGRLSDSAVLAALEETGAAHLLGQQIRHLSGGEFQRVMLARAIARKPDVLVLDEPVQGVDYSGEVAIYELISKIRHRIDCGILMVSHNLHVVMAETDMVICLNGHVCCSGAPVAVAESDAYRNLFGVRGEQLLAVYPHHHDHTHLPDGRVRQADGTITESCGHNHDHEHHGEGHDHAG